MHVANDPGICMEILFALNGVSSSIIYHNERVYLKDILTPSDVIIVDHLAEIGGMYCKLKTFISDTRNKACTTGLYLGEMVKFLSQILKPYQTQLLELENVSPLNLNIIYSKIYPYRELLIDLLKLVNSIICHETRGVAVLQRIYDHYLNSVRSVNVALGMYVGFGEIPQVVNYLFTNLHEESSLLVLVLYKEIFFIRMCQGVSIWFLKQLENWLLYGELIDRYNEFFIQKIASEDATFVTLTPYREFTLVHEQIPTFIRPGVAEKILIVGQTVLFLRSNPKNEGTLIDSSGITGESRARARKLISKMTALQPDLIWKNIENLVDELGRTTTTQLYLFATKDNQLNEQLHLVKDFLLLGRGELFQEYVVQTDNLLIRSYSKSLLFDLNQTLKDCARKLLLSENCLQQFKLELQEHSESGSQLGFHYNMPWPLELLFTSENMHVYNRLFQFLLRIKRVQVHMIRSWVNDKANRTTIAGPESARKRLQHNLWFLINNLQYYLHVDVLDSQFMALENALANTQDFEAIQKAHKQFLLAIESQMFQDSHEDPSAPKNPAQQRINDILDLCDEFNAACNLAQIKNVNLDSKAIDAFELKFNAFFELLLKLLNALKRHWGHSCCQHLSQLLLRLDFNGYFSLKFASDVYN